MLNYNRHIRDYVADAVRRGVELCNAKRSKKLLLHIRDVDQYQFSLAICLGTKYCDYMTSRVMYVCIQDDMTVIFTPRPTLAASGSTPHYWTYAEISAAISLSDPDAFNKLTQAAIDLAP